MKTAEEWVKEEFSFGFIDEVEPVEITSNGISNLFLLKEQVLL